MLVVELDVQEGAVEVAIQLVRQLVKHHVDQDVLLLV